MKNNNNKKLSPIFMALLATKFEEIDSIAEVVEATPNPERAIELLCGLYKEPVIRKKVEDTREGVLTLSRYDMWDDRVYYNYLNEEMKTGYFPKDTKKEDVTMDNFEELVETYRSGADQQHMSIPTGKLIESSASTYLDNWKSKKDAK